MATLETRVREYIRDNSQKDGNLALPLSQIAEDIDSSTATVWRAIQKLERKRVVKVVKPTLKTEPNSIYYLGEEDELNDLIDDMMMKTANVMVLLRELKSKIEDKDSKIFDLEQQIKNKR